jgi:hypothetical protein
MILNNWKPYLKLSDQGYYCMAQQTYEPLVSPDGKTFCKNYNFPNKYQYIETKDRPLYTKEVVDWFWSNELMWIEYFKDKPYAPEVLEIDLINKRIFLRWYGESCNQTIYSEKLWPQEQWRKQIRDIIVDQYNEGVYKLTMYPHCHYISSDGNMRAIDWYGCVAIKSPYVEEKYMQGIIHETAQFRLEETGAAVNKILNLETMFKRSLGTHVFWGDQNMSYIYKELFNDI